MYLLAFLFKLGSKQYERNTIPSTTEARVGRIIGLFVKYALVLDSEAIFDKYIYHLPFLLLNELTLKFESIISWFIFYIKMKSKS